MSFTDAPGSVQDASDVPAQGPRTCDRTRSPDAGRETLESPIMDTEPSGLPNALLVMLAIEQWPAVQELVAKMPEVDNDRRALLAAARVLLTQIPLNSKVTEPLSAAHLERLEEVIALCGIILRQHGRGRRT